MLREAEKRGFSEEWRKHGLADSKERRGDGRAGAGVKIKVKCFVTNPLGRLDACFSPQRVQ